MNSIDIIKFLEEIRESIIWNSVPDVDFEDNNREQIVIEIDDIIARIQNPQDED